MYFVLSSVIAGRGWSNWGRRGGRMACTNPRDVSLSSAEGSKYALVIKKIK